MNCMIDETIILTSTISIPNLPLYQLRHGDSCSARQMRNKKRTCDPLSVYMEQAVLPMAKK